MPGQHSSQTNLCAKLSLLLTALCFAACTQKISLRPRPAASLMATGNCRTRENKVNLVGWGTVGLPRMGRVVREAHYVTTEDSQFENRWPAHATDGIDDHLSRSCALLHEKFAPALKLLNLTKSCQEIYRQSGAHSWTPAEGGKIGQGARQKPASDREIWQGNLYFREGSLPPPDTRYLFFNPRNKRVVVVAMGYESGPRRGDGDFLAGITSEASWYLGHDNDQLYLGLAAEQSLPFGPISCDANE